jgi:hypothetical protein
LQIILIETNEITLRALERAFQDRPDVKCCKVDSVHYFAPPTGLDAIFLTLIAAERWGSRPLIGKAQVLRTSLADQSHGMPPYVVTGVAMSPHDARGPIPETTLLLKTAFEAIAAFNESSQSKIRVVGFWTVNLLNGLDAEQLAAIFHNVLPVDARAC